jgi:4-hydroxy-3-polyprenylbenzoate decarboxylase
MQVTAITHRDSPTYMSTFTGRAPDEPSVLAEALVQVFAPLLRQQFPEITDIWLPPETCSYRVAVVAFRKAYPGHARRLMMGLWSCLAQFTMTKIIIAVDPDIDHRDWKDVMWAVATRADPSRDLLVLADTPVDTLDFASPRPGLGGKLGIDATTKGPPEAARPFRRPWRCRPRWSPAWTGCGPPRSGGAGSGEAGPVSSAKDRLVIAISGASGAVVGLRMIDIAARPVDTSCISW